MPNDVVLSNDVVVFIAFACIVITITAVLMVMKKLFFPNRERPTRLRDAVRAVPRADRRNQSALGAIDHWLDRTVYLSGLGIGTGTAVALLLVAILGTGGITLVLTENPTLTIVAGIVTATVVLCWLEISKRRRLQAFEIQFPTALDILSRAVRAGESLEQAIELVATASRDLVATEFRRCSKQLDMGLSVPATMEAMTQRIGSMDVRIFSNTLSIHRELGGNLPETLERLAGVIRDRHEYIRQVKSVTSAGRFSIMLVLALGPLLFGYMFLFQPEYGNALWQDPTGRVMLIGAVVSQVAGIFWVMQVLRRDY